MRLDDMRTDARIIEIGEVAAGIVVRADSRHLRFHAAAEPFERLDGRLFRSAREVLAAASALLERPPRRRPPARPPVGPDEPRDARAEFMLAAYGQL